MRIYVGHSKDINYQEELYKPIKEYEKSNNHTFILPHDNNNHINYGREFYGSFDLLIAEVSMPATGLGIELGWAYDSKVPIYCIYKKGNRISNSLKAVTDKFFEYETTDDLKQVLKLILENSK